VEVKVAAPSEVALRDVDSTDLPFLRRLYSSNRAGELALTGWGPEVVEAFLAMQFKAREFHYLEHFPTSEDLLILVDGRAAGRLRVDRLVGEIRIIDIALLPEHQGAGIGSALIASLQRDAVAAGIPIVLQVAAGNAAANLYRRLGFVIDSRDGVYDVMRWQPEPIGVGSRR
jgi:ribosomal protein S18 acetylase RimI-like enzyme